MPLNLTNITKSFGSQTVLQSFSCSFPEKGLCYITGESGIGKTTLLRIIAGLDSAYTGEVSGAGHCSFLFQDRRLFDTLTALENVSIVNERRGIPRAQVRDEAKALLLSLNFSEEDLHKRPPELSGGMKQRVAIARALFFEAPILLLDEPSKELDQENRAILTKRIAEEANKRLVIAVTHDEEEIARSTALRIPLPSLCFTNNEIV